MTIEQIRKEIKVLQYVISPHGIEIIYYLFHVDFPEKKHLVLTPEDSARQLSAIGSIDSWEHQPFRIWSDDWGEDPQDWETFSKNFKLSQYEALTLAIRHEYELSIEKDSNIMDLTNSINKLNQLK